MELSLTIYQEEYQNRKEEFQITIDNKIYDNIEDAGEIIKVLLDNAVSTEEK